MSYKIIENTINQSENSRLSTPLHYMNGLFHTQGQYPTSRSSQTIVPFNLVQHVPFLYCFLMACQFWRHSFLGVRLFHQYEGWCGVTSLSVGVSSDLHQHNGNQDSKVRQCTKQGFAKLRCHLLIDDWNRLECPLAPQALTFTSPPFALTIVSSLYINTYCSSYDT